MLVAVDVAVTLPTGRQLFANVNLRVRRGDTIAISGPSGMGKSTLLAVLGGLVAPSAGAVEVTPVDRPQRENLEWVLQGLNCLPARRVIDNVMLSGLTQYEDRNELREEAMSSLRAVGLGDYAYERARVLSGGELQRMTVARALTSRRPIVLADEPTNQLDRSNARRVMQLLAAEAARDRAVVIVTHDASALPTGIRQVELTSNGLQESTRS